MAKGNLFQGMGRGKIGDVVFSRLNGQQVSRVRNRNPKNPRSNAQLYQRAIMATIMQAYSAGKKIFDHSFQGYAVGANNMAVFMRENLKILRQQIAYEISSEMLAENMQANCVWPGANQPVANAYLISKGNYKQKAFIETRPGGSIYYTLPEPEANEKVNEYAARVGLLADDYYTFCLFLEGTNELFHAFEGLEDPAGIGYDCRFGYVRLHVKSNVASIEDAIATKSQLFDVDASMNIDETFMTENVAEGISMSDLDVTGRGVGSIGLIRSRKDRDLRSTSYMYCPTKAQQETNDFGIKAIYINEAWQRGTESLGNSDLILEGGGGAKPAPTPSTNWGLLVTGIYSTIPDGRSMAIIYDNAVPKIAVVKVNQVTAGSYSLENARAMVVGGANDDTDKEDVNSIFVGAANQYSSNDSIALFNNNEEGGDGQSLMEALLGHFPIVESDLYEIGSIEQVTQQNDGYIVSQQDVLNLLPVDFIGAINV